MNTPRTGEFVIPISYESTEIIETGNWSSLKPQTANLTAPCREHCPVGTDIPGFIDLVQRGHYEKALEAIVLENPLPGVCGRVCHHPCESACNRSQWDESVSIRALERFVASRAKMPKMPFSPSCPSSSRKIAIVGSGPAGLACAYFLALLGHCAVIYEEKSEPGGVLRWGIPQFRLPVQILKRDLKRIFPLPIELKTGCRVGRDIALNDLMGFDAIFLSPGAERSAPLSVAGENLAGVWAGVEFLKKIRAGAKMSPGKETLVIGGGNTAIDVARTASRLGSRVTVAYRRTRAAMLAVPEEIQEAEEEGIQFEFLVQPVKIERVLDERLAVTFQRMESAGLDSANRPAVFPVAGEFMTLIADTVIAAVGERVDLTWVPKEMVKNGHIVPEFNSRIFAGGDAVLQPRTVVSAIASGKKAAILIDAIFCGMDKTRVLSKIQIGSRGSLSMKAYLAGKERGNWSERPKIITAQEINPLYIEFSRRQKDKKVGPIARLKNFSEVNLTMGASQARRAAARCHSCGVCNFCGSCYYFCPEGVITIDPGDGLRTVDFAHCKGCGVCMRSCLRGALRMEDSP